MMKKKMLEVRFARPALQWWSIPPITIHGGRNLPKWAITRGTHLCSSAAYISPPREVVRERAGCVVIGAGVVGLAAARKLAMEGRDVLVLEASSGIGTGISSRNSEVIHAGIYYPQGSVKAQLCVEGRHALYSYCRDHGVAHKRLGKLIVATNPCQIQVLEALQKVGTDNGVEGLRLLDGDEANRLEPQLQCVKALWSPSTGILDSHTFMLALQADAENHGATFAFNTSVFRGDIYGKGLLDLHICSTSELNSRLFSDKKGFGSMILCADSVINASGLSAISLAKRLEGFPVEFIPKCYYARGCYFSLSGVGVAPFSHLIYPVPEEGGLGVHVTLDLGGQARFGPDVEWLEDIDEYTAFKYE
eukprot:c24289_g1_i2 orf=46-1131(+)